jgi:tRNA pseudouridine38-40 synthase
MHRDESDEWLDEVLIERSSDIPSIFSVSSLVVESFISSGVNDSRPVLRRVSNFNDSVENKTTVKDETLFGPLFCLDNYRNDDDKISPTKITRTSKKNRKRTNLKITLAYRGLDFCGWEDQRHELYRKNNNSSSSNISNNNQQLLPSVQGTLADILGPAVGSSLNTKPIEIKVAGRTDRGVSAIGQVCRVRTWKEIPNIETYVQDLVNRNETRLHVSNVEQVGNDFHPSFGAVSRSYVYLIDLEDDESRIAPSLVPKLDRMLRELEGKELDYFALSHGKVKTETTICTLLHARASIVEFLGNKCCDNSLQTNKQALCFELVGNRFLRREVRLLVGTALREARRDVCDDQALLKILESKDRRKRSRAAPPDGLIFVDAKV